MSGIAIMAIQIASFGGIAALSTWFMFIENHNFFISLSIGLSSAFILLLTYNLVTILRAVMRDAMIDVYVWFRLRLGYGYPDD